MKRFLALMLVIVLLTASACSSAPKEKGNLDTAPAPTVVKDRTGYEVTDPMAYPDYTFEGDPDVMEIRATAVRAMRDLLSIRWSTAESFHYQKTGPISEKIFTHEKDTTYAGVLYSSASAGIFQFLEFYDHETGRLYYPDGVSKMKKVIGASCADALIWSWNTVVTSIDGLYYPNTMVYANGYYPVGDYTYDFSVKNYSFLPTYTIIEQNGRDVILESYAKVLMADALVSTSDNHGMMAIENAHVVYKADGSIDSANSYIMIQDQRGGQGAGFYEVKEGGEIIRYSGRTSFKYTFDMLLSANYIPVAPAEFLGTKKYEHAEVTCSAEKLETLADLTSATISTNYPLALINAFLVYPDGGKVLIDRTTFNGDNRVGVPKTYELNKMKHLVDGEFMSVLKEDNTYYVEIEVVVSNGTRHIAAKLPIDC